MTWLASLTRISEGELDRLIKRIAAILVVGTLVFVGFYVFDRFRMPAPSMVDQTIASLEAAVREDPADVPSGKETLGRENPPTKRSCEHMFDGVRSGIQGDGAA